MPSWIRLSTVVLLLLLGAGCVEAGREHRVVPKEQASPPGEPVPGTSPAGASGALEVAELGKSIFTGRGICATCHGADATGTPIAPNLTDEEWLNLESPVTVEAIAELIETGVPDPVAHPAPMPPMGGASLTEDEVEAVATYVYSLSQ